jgi:hypothetical protein
MTPWVPSSESDGTYSGSSSTDTQRANPLLKTGQIADPKGFMALGLGMLDPSDKYDFPTAREGVS